MILWRLFGVLGLLLFLPNWGQTQAVTSGLTGCWHFDETSGSSAADCSAGGHTINAPNTIAWQSSASGNCKLNGCAATSSATSSQYFGTGAALTTLGTRSAFTMSVWFKTTATPQNATDVYDLPLIVGDANLYAGLFWGQVAGGPATIHAYNWSGGLQITSWPTAYTSGSLIHIAWVHGSNTLRLYINGTQVGTPVTSGDTDIAAGNIGAFGAVASAACNTICVVDELYTYNRELTATEIGQLAGLATGGGLKRNTKWED